MEKDWNEKERSLEDIMDITLVQAEPVVMDYESMREKLTATLEQYKGIQVTETNLSTCKEMKKEISSIKTQLDEFRKKVKKTYTEPLKIFEDQVKSMIGMVDQILAPLQSDLKVFDEKRKQEKKEIAEEIIKAVAAEYELSEKYARMIEFKIRYMNLTIKESEVRQDVEAQCMALKQKQDAEEEVRKVISDTVASENETLKAKLNPDEFLSMMERIPSAEIISRIVKRAKDVRESESEAHRRQEKVEQEQVINNAENVPEIENKGFQEIEEEPEPKTTGALYRVTYVVTGTEPQLKTISRFLRSNKYTYEVESQFPVG